jgi:hypothetical protein
MNYYAIAVFLHIVGALGLFVALGLEWTSLLLLRRATTTEQVRERMRIASGVRGVSGVSLATLLVSGFYMTATVWGGVAWIAVTLGAMVLMAVLGAVLSGPRLAAMGRAVENGALAPVPHPLLWVSMQIRVAIALGIVFLMTFKPDLNGSLLAIAVAAVLGLVAALPALTPGRPSNRPPDHKTSMSR